MSHFLSHLPSLNAVLVGGLYHKPAVLSDLLGKSVRLVVHEHEFEGESTIGIGGSCTLIAYRQRAFVVTTRHQLALASGAVPPPGQFDTLRFQTSVGGYLKNILVDSCIHESSNPDQEYHDLLFFRVQCEWLEHSADRPYFFPIEPFKLHPRRRTFFYGHPVSRNEVRHQPLEAAIRTAVIDGELELGFHTHAEYLRRYAYPKVDYEVNGFSGGAAFSLLGAVDGGFKIVLDGIIVRGGAGHFLVVDADYLIEALQHHAGEP